MESIVGGDCHKVWKGYETNDTGFIFPREVRESLKDGDV
jgi:hypothetical protein